MPANPPTVYPCLVYRDARAAIAWLCRGFGFEVLLEVPGPDGAVAHAELSFGTGVVMIGTARDAEVRKSPPGLPAAAPSVYVAVDDLAAHCERARSAGAEIAIEPRDTDYGSREYHALDTEGHPWCFGTYRPAPR